MSKRKGGVRDIIYELDDDVVISSDEDATEAKISTVTLDDSNLTSWSRSTSGDTTIDVVNLDCSTEGDCVFVPPATNHNGGKTSPDLQLIEVQPENQIDKRKHTENQKANETIVFNEDIVIDSPHSNSDLGVVGCENRRPIISVKFRDQRLAKACKEEMKAFMLRLIKLHDKANWTESETETNLELDIWPEDLIEEDDDKEKDESLFFMDTHPAECQGPDEIPRYSHVSLMYNLYNFLNRT